jgi:hypothetical protein
MRRVVTAQRPGPEPSVLDDPAEDSPGPARSEPEVTGADSLGLQTEFSFVLPRGLVLDDGSVHREGTMRLATAKDELLPLFDERVRENPAYLSIVLLARVVTSLGRLTDEQIKPPVIERLFASDLAFLQDLYRRVNTDGSTQAVVRCPSCDEEFVVELAGERLGES